MEEVRATFTRTRNPQDIRLQTPDHLPMINADRSRLSQVLYNFLANACKFSPSLSTVTIQVEHGNDPTHLTVRVHD